jgi:two-component system, response regulator YesN
MLADAIEVLVVDDEPKQRRGLAAMVRSLRPHYRVHEAKNGKEAFELAKNRSLDIVFTDIRMPIVNGMEFVEALTETGFGMPKVVFVSVFHEFGYAKQALRLGAKDYLVKPVSEEHLAAVIDDLEVLMDRESDQLREAKHLSAELAYTKPIYMDHLLYKWMNEPLQPAERREVKEHYPYTGSGTVLILETRSEADGESGLEWRSILKRAVAQTLVPLADYRIVAPEFEKNRLYVIAAWKPISGSSAMAGLNKLRDTLAQLASVHGRSAFVGVGKETANLEADIRACCVSARTALEYVYYLPDPDVGWLTSESLEAMRMDAAQGSIGAQDLDSMEEAVMNSQMELAAAMLQETVGRLAAGYPSPFRLKCQVIQLLLACIKRAEPVLDNEAYRRLADRIDQELLASSSLQGTKTAAVRLLSDIVHQMKLDKGSRSEMIMQKCKEFLEDHLHEDLGLEMTAQRFFYNPSYFSILFKNHFGMSFTDYLVKARLQKARGLLLQSDQKIADIARLVGYKDIKYFNKVFKRMFMYAPEEFRRMFTH